MTKFSNSILPYNSTPPLHSTEITYPWHDHCDEDTDTLKTHVSVYIIPCVYHHCILSILHFLIVSDVKPFHCLTMGSQVVPAPTTVHCNLSSWPGQTQSLSTTNWPTAVITALAVTQWLYKSDHRDFIAYWKISRSTVFDYVAHCCMAVGEDQV